MADNLRGGIIGGNTFTADYCKLSTYVVVFPRGWKDCSLVAWFPRMTANTTAPSVFRADAEVRVSTNNKKFHVKFKPATCRNAAIWLGPQLFVRYIDDSFLSWILPGPPFDGVGLGTRLISLGSKLMYLIMTLMLHVSFCKIIMLAQASVLSYKMLSTWSGFYSTSVAVVSVMNEGRSWRNSAM